MLLILEKVPIQWEEVDVTPILVDGEEKNVILDFFKQHFDR